MRLNFFVPLTPAGKQSARKGKYGNFYIPKKSADFIKTVQGYAWVEAKLNGHKITEKAISVIITAYLENEATKKPDVDNICKCVLDSMTGVVYKDDSQVTSLSIKKIGPSKKSGLSIEVF